MPGKYLALMCVCAIDVMALASLPQSITFACREAAAAIAVPHAPAPSTVTGGRAVVCIEVIAGFVLTGESRQAAK